MKDEDIAFFIAIGFTTLVGLFIGGIIGYHVGAAETVTRHLVCDHNYALVETIDGSQLCVPTRTPAVNGDPAMTLIRFALGLLVLILVVAFALPFVSAPRHQFTTHESPPE